MAAFSSSTRNHPSLTGIIANYRDEQSEISQRLMALDLNELIIYQANRQVFQNWDKSERPNVRDKSWPGPGQSLGFHGELLTDGETQQSMFHNVSQHSAARFHPNCLIWDHIDYKILSKAGWENINRDCLPQTPRRAPLEDLVRHQKTH